MTGVYVVIDEYRPSDVDVIVFATEQAAIVYARSEARERARARGTEGINKQLVSGMTGTGWLDYGLRLVARDVREG